ncbi:T9SS type A sorting domain-containing protein [Taibaiella soli]|uniref:Secretion system C-terminal sorting domain-containing protein n=1 Tax=Taibaiella soli TaxID=1649169 RepID=A0A2W2ANW6_9BACT|nr:T9SS type A sorting domain-containing protein [Taibaiella soli]PZF74060.1 hypothetical protein DN068_05040 [Taibaiella soli]
MNKLIVLFLSLLFVKNSIAQVSPPSIKFSKTFGGSHDDLGDFIIQTRDKNYLIGGRTNSTDGDIVVPGSDTIGGHYDIFLVKTDSVGTKQWTKVLNNFGDEYLAGIIETDSAYVLAGGTYTDHNHDFASLSASSGFLIWIDKNSGDIINIKDYRQTSISTVINGIALAPDGNLVCAGTYVANPDSVLGNKGSADAWIMKVEQTTGNIIWQKFWGGSGSDRGYGIIPDGNGGYTIDGDVMSTDGDAYGAVYGPHDCFVINVDSIGNTRWFKRFGSSGSVQYLNRIGKTANGYFVAGFASGDGAHVHGSLGDNDIWVMKLNNTGDTVWTRVFGGSYLDRNVSIAVTNDGGVFMNNVILSHDGTFGNSGVLFGNYLIRLDSNGNIVWKNRMGSNKADAPGQGIVTCDNGYVFTAEASQVSRDVTGIDHGSFEMWLCKLNVDGLDNLTPDAPCNYQPPAPPQPSAVAQLNPNGSVSLYPNPTTGIFQLKNLIVGSNIKMMNLVGQKVYEQTAVKKEEQINPGTLAPGLYLVQITTPDKTVNNLKLVIQ